MAEQLLEDKSRELYNSNQELQRRNQKIAEQSRDLQRQVVELQQTRQQLVQSEKMAVIGQLAAGVAHEINTPVGFVASNLDSLKDYLAALSELVIGQKQYLDKFDSSLQDNEISRLQKQANQMNLDSLLPDIDQLIGDCSEGAERIRRIVADLADFIYPETFGYSSHAWQYQHRKILTSCFEKAINVASREIKSKADIELYLGELPPVICNGGKIGQVFLNLLVNAAQAIPEWGLIKVVSGEGATGSGLKSATTVAVLPRPTERKFSIPSLPPRRLARAPGLVCMWSKGAVEMHGGEIRSSSKEGFGACFRVSLPVAGKSEILFRFDKAIFRN